MFNLLRLKCHYSAFVITSQYKSYNLCMLWTLKNLLVTHTYIQTRNVDLTKYTVLARYFTFKG